MEGRASGKAIRRGIVIAVLLAAALVLPPFINVGRYKGRVIDSMSKALGRPVTCDSIELRLLPQPGFYLANVAIGDDPAYSLEPILHAEEVNAYLGVSSLWRGHMEIARLNLNYPSLNLVERDDGSWNLESLLWKAARTQAAPTATRLSISRPRFPYIEATNGRINFKYGLRKSVFSFTEADFALWSPAENQWRMRLEARPVRTDMPVTDTGTVKAEATVQRAELLRDAPMKATVTWERVQLGNLTRLIEGEDRGWRGALDMSAQLSGSPAALHFTTSAELRDFRRFDISTGDAANLSASCEGELNVSTILLQHTECRLPLNGGQLSVQGTMQGLHSPHYDLTIAAENIGADAVLNLARRAKHNLPEDLTAAGIISASFHGSRVSEAPSSWVGNLEVNSLAVRSSVLGKALTINKAVAAINTAGALPLGRRGRRAKASPPLRALVVQSFDLPLGAATPAKIDGTLDREHFALHLKGDATLERLQQFARAWGIGAPKFSLTGPAAIDLLIGGDWASFEAPQVTGTAQLKNAHAQVPGLSAPVEISSARVELDRDRIALRNASATIGKISLGGSAGFPRSCDADSPCQASFDLSTDDLNPERWNEVLNPHVKKTPWYYFGDTRSGSNVFATLRTTGHITSRHLTLGTITGSAFETDFSSDNGMLELKNTRADLFGGKVSGDWKIDFTGGEPSYESIGSAERIQAEKLTPLLKASVGTGTVGVQYELKMTGWDAASLMNSASAEAAFSWTGGALKVSPDPPAPMRVFTGKGKAALDKDGWTISASQWKTPDGTYHLDGQVSRDSVLALEFSQDNGSEWKVSGTLAKPQTGMAAPEPTQARRR
ncbi:MAG: AsmA family protein [Candidatus Korobacteraceae bacterium]